MAAVDSEYELTDQLKSSKRKCGVGVKYISILDFISPFLAVLLSVGMTAVVTLSIYQRGANPPKDVEVRFSDPSDPLADFSSLEGNLSLNFQIGDRSLSNITIIQTNLKNTGASPILPTDFAENLSLNVAPPWQIVGIVNALPNTPNVIPLEWTKINDTKFQAIPTLLNPDDIVWVKVYLTNPNIKGGQQLRTTSVTIPKLEWGGHVVNLKQFTFPDDPVTRERKRISSIGVNVSLSGDSLVFTVIAFICYLIAYFPLMKRAGVFEPWNTTSVLIIVVVTCLSLASAEATATYIYGSLLTDISGISHLLNAPWIIVNTITLLMFRFYFCNGRTIRNWRS